MVSHGGRRWLAIHFAARTNNVAHAGLLLRYGANPNHPDSFNRPPLFIAMHWDHCEIVRLLLRHGARLDMVDDGKMTVLHYAARYSNAPTLRLLCREDLHGISRNCRDSQGQTPPEGFLRTRPLMMSKTEDENLVAREIFDQLLNGTGG